MYTVEFESVKSAPEVAAMVRAVIRSPKEGLSGTRPLRFSRLGGTREEALAGLRMIVTESVFVSPKERGELLAAVDAAAGEI